jgi:ABC-type multidrug transport system ATPase subunit
VRFVDVGLRYGRGAPWVLSEVDCTLLPGQAAVVLGRNGAGKTTLLAAAAGLLRPDRGRIEDRPGRVGWVPERFPAGQPFDVRRYLVAMAQVRGLGRAEAETQVRAWADRLYLTRYLDTRLTDVSKGTAQKAGLIQALVPRPDLLVLDEPWEGLDEPTRREIPTIVDEMLAAGGSVLVSDHMHSARVLPQAVSWLVGDGQVRVEGETTGTRWVIEVGVAAADVTESLARLRAQGHDILGVREAH